MGRKIWLVAQREFLYNFSRRIYLFTAFGIPLIIALSTYFVVQFIVDTESNLDDFRAVGVVDEAGVFSTPIKEEGPFILYTEESQAESDLRAKTLAAYFVLPADYMQMGQIRYLSDKKLPEQLRENFSKFIVAGLVAEQDDSLQRVIDPLDIVIHVLGTEDELSMEAAILRFSLPLIIGFLLVFNVTVSSQFLMSGLVEERENHILEILMTSLRPIDLMAGKVLGLGALTLLQMSFWIGISFFWGVLTNRLGVLSEARFGADFVLLALSFGILYFFLFTGIMLGIGAVAAAEQEARQLASIFTLIAILPPSWGLGLILENPDSPLAIGMALFPLTSPITIMTLVALDEAPIWLIFGSLALLVLALAGVVWLSAKLFRLGMLNSRPNWRKLMRLKA